MLSSILLIQDSLSHIAPLKVATEFCLNINSLTRHLDEIRIFIEDKQPHILCLNEIKIDDSISEMILKLKVILSIEKTEMDLVVVLQSTYTILSSLPYVRT